MTNSSLNRCFQKHALYLFEKGYEPIPITPGYKYPRGLKEWQNTKITPDQIKEWNSNSYADAGIGIRTAKTPAIDIDVQHDDVVCRTIEMIEMVMGHPHPILRIGLPPKVLLPCRTDHPFRKLVSSKYRSPDGREHKLEILGKGQQFVAYGIHPDTRKPYVWDGPLELLDFHRNELPLLTSELAQKIIRIFETEIIPADWEPVSGADLTNSKEIGCNGEEIDPFVNMVPRGDFTIEDLCNDLAVLDPNMTRQGGWLQVGFGIYHQFADTDYEEEAKRLFDEWSQGGTTYKPDEIDQIWSSFENDPNRGRPITYATIRKMADKIRGRISHVRPESISEVVLVCAADITARAVSWIWPGWLAHGKLHILAGQPGCGKSTIAFNLAACITNGGTWPDGTSCSTPGNVLIWSGEDSPDDTIVPRLHASGADMKKVFIIRGIKEGDSNRSFDPAKDLKSLKPIMEQRRPQLLIVDSVVSAVGHDSHKNTETRRDLQPLVDLAETYETAILGITHFTKGTAGRDPLERVTGSLAFGALPRVVMVAAKLDPGNKYGAERLFARSKSNIGQDEGGFGYSLPVVNVGIDGVMIEAITVTWGKLINDTAREMLSNSIDANRDGGTGAVAEAKRFLFDFLEGGSKKFKEVCEVATVHGITPSTLRRAKTELNVKAVKMGMNDGWAWELPEKLTAVEVEVGDEPW